MSKLVESQSVSQHTSMNSNDVVVVGAGPYGLSIAAHLLQHGLKVTIFGKVFQLWREYMPRGMRLRSYWWATSLSDPHHHYSLARYLQEHDIQPVDPFPVELLIDYGLWFQRSAVPAVDETYIQSIEHDGALFRLTLVDGRVIQSRMVVMAPGLYYYAYTPVAYQMLPPELVSHTRDHHTFDRFTGKDVLIVGKGQSALETAALAHESGVHVQLVSRSQLLWIEEGKSSNGEQPLLERLLHPKAGISSGWLSWGLERFPYMFQRLPRSLRADMVRRLYGPMGSSWLKPRVLGNVTIHEKQHVQSIRETENGVTVLLSNGKTLNVDHIILGTGYRVDINKLPMVHSSLLSKIETDHGAPVLNNYFESSIPGLYFVGFSSVASYGPLYRFVVGTDAAARRIVSAVIK